MNKYILTQQQKIVTNESLILSSDVISPATDYDGNIYTEVVIGNQTWLKEPLRTSKDWFGNTVDYKSPNNDANNDLTFGRLYNYNTLQNQSAILPYGYRIPTINEMYILLQNYTRYTSYNYFYWEQIAQQALRATGTTYWNNGTGTDIYGFNALGAGYYFGDYFGFMEYNLFWSSRIITKTIAYEINSSGRLSELSYGLSNTLWYLSCRMIKN